MQVGKPLRGPDMRITVQALIEGIDGQAPTSVTVGVIERDADRAPSSGFGLFLRETHAGTSDASNA